MGISEGAFDSFNQLLSQPQCKKRKVVPDSSKRPSACAAMSEIKAPLPTLRRLDYFMKPCLFELIAGELMDPGYCSRVQDFTVGILGYGCVKFSGETDVRWLDLDQIVKFSRHEIIVYEDESTKPVVGQGLNKAAEVTLLMKLRPSKVHGEDLLIKKLRLSTERQGAELISFDPKNSEWKFTVPHFSRFGPSDELEEDIAMEDVTPEVQNPAEMNGNDGSDIDEEAALMDPTLLSHSLLFLHTLVSIQSK